MGRFLKKYFSKVQGHISQNKNQFYIEFMKFAIVGITNTLVYYFVNLSTLWILFPLSLNYDYVIGNGVGFIFSVLWSFYWNNRFVFRREKALRKDLGLALVKAYISYAFTGIVLNNIISFVLIEKLCISKYIVPLINSLISVPINFILNKWWTFRN